MGDISVGELRYQEAAAESLGRRYPDLWFYPSKRSAGELDVAVPVRGQLDKRVWVALSIAVARRGRPWVGALYDMAQDIAAEAGGDNG